MLCLSLSLRIYVIVNLRTDKCTSFLLRIAQGGFTCPVDSFTRRVRSTAIL